MKPETEIRVAKVKEELWNGATRTEIVATLSNEFAVAPRTMDFYITRANKELEKELAERRAIIASIRQEQIADQAKELIMTELEADAYLTQIIRGERKEEKIVSTRKGGVQVIKVAPRISDVIKAFRSYYVRESNKRYTRS